MVKKTRSYCFTLNNFTKDEHVMLVETFSNECSYWVVGEEKGEQGTPHLQGYIYMINAKTITTLKKWNSRVHWEAARGSPLEASTYCKKDGKFVEFGKLPEQGLRTDLKAINDSILAGTTVDSICLSNPAAFHQYGRTFQKTEDLRMRKLFRNFTTTGTWYHGPTGTGKSHKAFEGYSPDTHYLYPNDGGWWDGYVQQETVIFNDFRADIPYAFLLQLIDKWPVSVKRRGREPLPFMSKHVIITSSLTPEKCYHGVLDRDDNIDQLLRRMNIIEIAQKYSGGNTRTPEQNLFSKPITLIDAENCSKTKVQKKRSKKENV